MAASEANPNDGPLDLAYYYTLDKRKKPTQMKVVWELTSKDEHSDVTLQSRTPLRFVAVIDESGSMDNRVGNDSMSLIQRMRLFAELMVQNLKEEDQMAIVTFANDARVKLPMTQLNEEGKVKAMDAIQTLRTRGATNLSEGLFAAIQLFKSEGTFHNGIVLFTDGVANEGIRHADFLVREFNARKASCCGDMCISLSTFTIGDYRPDLLYEVSQRLGSDAFFWLSNESNFEADMMMPIFLRETSRASNIRVTLRALNGLSFDLKNMGNPLMTEETAQLQSGSESKYYIHDISEGIAKNIPCVVNLPEEWETVLTEKDAVEAQVSYVGIDQTRKEILATVRFKGETVEELMKEEAKAAEKRRSSRRGGSISNDRVRGTGSLRRRDGRAQVPERRQSRNNKEAVYNGKQEVPTRENDLDIPEACKEIVAHTSDLPGKELNKVQRAEIAIVKTANEDCRTLAVESINKAVKMMGYGSDKSWVPGSVQTMQEGINNINKVKEDVKSVVGKQTMAKVDDYTTSMIDNLDFCLTLLDNPQPSHWARMKAMESSMANEAPTAGGVFEQNKQPFVPPKLTTKVEKVTKEVKKQKGHAVPDDPPPPPPPKPKPRPKPTENKPKTPDAVKESYKEAKKTRVEPISKPFKRQYFTLSEKLVAGKVAKNSTETIKELVIKHGGTPVPFVQNSVMVCTKGEFEKKTAKIRDAMTNKIPIVFEEFIYDSIKAKKMLDIDEYRFW